MIRTDVVIAGAGPAGAACAITLATAGRSVSVVDDAGDRRVRRAAVGEILPAAARPVLERLGAWVSFRDDGHGRSPGMASTWGQPGGRASLTNPFGPAWHLDRRRFDAGLVKRAAAAGATICAGHVDDVVADPTGVTVTIRRGETEERFVARWIVDATGRRRHVARRAGATVEHGDRLIGVTAVLPRPYSGAACIEAVVDGWWYRAPLTTAGQVVVFFTDPDLPSAAIARHPDGLAALAAGTKHIAEVAPEIAGATLQVVAAGTSWLSCPSGPGWIAAGDAVSTIDPLSGRGVLAALAGGMRAAEAIVGHSVDDRASIAGYDRWVTGVRVRDRLAQRSAYLIERRFSHALFWKRRHPSNPNPADGGSPELPPAFARRR